MAKKSKGLKTSQKKAVLAIALVVLVVGVAISFVPKNAANNPNFSDPLADRKAKILALASNGGPLSADGRSFIFQSLSGPRMLRYNFTREEKIKIINAVNGSYEKPAPSVKKKRGAN